MGLLLQEVSADLGVSISAAGLLISGYALGVVVGAPLLTTLTAAGRARPFCSRCMVDVHPGQRRLRHRARLRERSMAAAC